jgi:hypothetical protein
MSGVTGGHAGEGQEAAASVAVRRKRAMAGDREPSGQAAAIVLGLTSVTDEASFITGQVIDNTGGQHGPIGRAH